MRLLTGSEAAAEAVRLCRPKIIAAYPITPQTHIIEKLAEMVESGTLEAHYICTESELSSIGIVAGAATEGVRAFTATSSHGLAFMHEALHWVAGGRLPVVMVVATRGLGAPWILMSDMQDVLSQRDTGWMAVFASNAQEVHDLIPIAYKVAEEVMIPCMVCMDGFLISHTAEPVSPLDQRTVDAFLPEPSFPLSHRGEPFTLWPIPDPDTYYEVRRDLFQDHAKAVRVWNEAFSEWERLTGRQHSPCTALMPQGAKRAFVAMGAGAETAVEAAEALQNKGEKIGVIKITLFRPFPEEEFKKLCRGLEELLVIDKAVSMGKCGILTQEIASCAEIPVKGFVGSLGGKDLTVERLMEFFELSRTEGGTLWI